MAAILNVLCHMRNPSFNLTPLIDVYLLEEHSWQISSQSDLKW